jgi:hypothetical protein
MTSEELQLENDKMEKRILDAIEYERNMYEDLCSRGKGDDFLPDSLAFFEIALEFVRSKDLTREKLLSLRNQSEKLPGKRVYYGVSVEWTSRQLDAWIQIRLMVLEGRW